MKLKCINRKHGNMRSLAAMVKRSCLALIYLIMNGMKPAKAYRCETRYIIKISCFLSIL